MTLCRMLGLCSIPFLLASGAPPSLILHNGKILTVDARSTVASAIAIEGNRIAATGSDAAILKLRGQTTRVLDLHGKTVLPGLIDSHVHALEAGLSEFREQLPQLNSIAQIQEYIRAKAQTLPKGEWILVPRTFPTRLKEMRMPVRQDLDVAPDHPVMLDASYVVVLNSAALRASGIDRTTPNPKGGEIAHDEHGEPNGILKNAAQLAKVDRRRASLTRADRDLALEQQLKRYVDAGLTAVGDRAVDPEQIALYRALHDQQRLPLRAVLTWRPDGSQPAASLIEQLRSARYTTGSGDSFLKFGAFKLTLDGGMTIGTAYQRAPYGAFGKQLYGKTDPADRGQLFLTPAKLLEVMRAARDLGWQLTTHDQGGGAVDTWIDTLEALDREKPIAGSRSFVMHASFQSPEAIARMKRIGIAADVQPQWLYLDGDALTRVFGEEGMRFFFPLRSYLEAGIPVASGSDHMIGHDRNHAINPYNPFLSMWIEVTRKTRSGKVLQPGQRITREQALRTHTIAAAWLQFAENERGSLEQGKLADLIVIDRDLMLCPEDDIREIRPLLVMIDGKIVSGQVDHL